MTQEMQEKLLDTLDTVQKFLVSEIAQSNPEEGLRYTFKQVMLKMVEEVIEEAKGEQ